MALKCSIITMVSAQRLGEALCICTWERKVKNYCDLRLFFNHTKQGEPSWVDIAFQTQSTEKAKSVCILLHSMKFVFQLNGQISTDVTSMDAKLPKSLNFRSGETTVRIFRSDLLISTRLVYLSVACERFM